MNHIAADAHDKNGHCHHISFLQARCSASRGRPARKLDGDACSPTLDGTLTLLACSHILHSDCTAAQLKGQHNNTEML